MAGRCFIEINSRVCEVVSHGFCRDYFLVFIHFTQLQLPDCVIYFVWGTLGIVWTVRFYFVNIQKVKTKIILVVNSGKTKFSTIIDRERCRHSISLFCYNTSKNLPGFAIRLRHSPCANFEVDWRNPKNPLSPKWRKGIPAKVRVYQSTGNVQLNWPKLFQVFSVKLTLILFYECVHSTYTASAFRVYLYDFDVYIQLGNNDR